MKIFKNILKFFLLAPILLLLLFLYSYFIEPNLLTKEKVILKLDCLKSNLKEEKIVHISDLHFSRKTSEKEIKKISDTIKKINPSLVFITGDFISEEGGTKPAIKLIEKISANYPVFAVFGNHDYWETDNIEEFKSSLEKAGAKILDNEFLKINLKEETINLIGIRDPFTSENKSKDLEKAMEGIEETDKNCKILLAHSPEIIQEAVRKNIDLVLVGHTHGGQIYIPFITEKMIPVGPEGEGFVKGLYKINRTQMYVNPGIGESILPLRFLVPPEITILTFTGFNTKQF